ncbi:hypothetical protein LCGC14_0171380 [marine sediment metagenome]|jgi:hypothetical protein|uniref:Uncharacterized protein n=1 Tax=marine sediment metagenome TaxID=412755 RepID=A0A0F9XV36_9ZZZZ|nr:hypothetical protein [Oceanospirillaceae bacterium]|tara:strand:- start:21518 stop:21862 length:345 start_codon:yes stop_codon:yes gene_type:complete
MWPKISAVFVLGVAALIVAPANASPYRIDQRDPQFQKAAEHLAQAAQALARAKRELELSEASYQLPGLNYSQMTDALRPVEETLQVILSPERKRYQHQTIIPDGVFFSPVTVGD